MSEALSRLPKSLSDKIECKFKGEIFNIFINELDNSYFHFKTVMENATEDELNIFVTSYTDGWICAWHVLSMQIKKAM